MERERFEALVRKALLDLPEEFFSRLENIEVVVEDWPSPRQLAESGLSQRQELLGLYEGVPLTQRSHEYQLVAPDMITLFRRPIEMVCSSEREIGEEVRKVVCHEIAHHFGISDERLEEIENDSSLREEGD